MDGVKKFTGIMGLDRSAPVTAYHAAGPHVADPYRAYFSCDCRRWHTRSQTVWRLGFADFAEIIGIFNGAVRRQSRRHYDISPKLLLVSQLNPNC